MNLSKIGYLLDVTAAVGCPLNCGCCPQELFVSAYSKTGGPRLMSFETFKACVDKVPKNVHVSFSGFCEPFVNPALADMIIYAHRSGFKLLMNTTAVGLTRGTLSRIEDIPFENIDVHMPDRENNTLVAAMPHHLETLEMLSHSRLHRRRFISLGEPHPAVVSLLGSGIETVAKGDLVSRAGALEHIRHPLLKYRKGAILCLRKYQRRNVLLPNGDLLLCCMDFGMKHVIGNLLRSPYREIVGGQPMRDILRRLKDEKYGHVICRRCELAGGLLSLLHLKISAAGRALRPWT